jgi:hypothetical protein
MTGFFYLFILMETGFQQQINIQNNTT